jgi:glycerate kinase
VRVLRERLRKLDVPDLLGSGAAGGLAGGLAAIGGQLRPGFDLVAERLGFDERIADADLVVTGEGLLDATSFTGKVVGRVLSRAAAAGVEALVVAGEVTNAERVAAVSLVEQCGRERAFAEPSHCVQEVVTMALAARRNGP